MRLFYEREVKENTSPHLAIVILFLTASPLAMLGTSSFPLSLPPHCCFLALPLRLSSSLVFSQTMVLSGPLLGLLLSQVLRGGKTLGQALSSGATSAFVALPLLLAKGLARLSCLADRVCLQAPLAYAALLVILLSSYSSPLFHTLSVTAASFRAIVSRAISGRTPLSTCPV